MNENLHNTEKVKEAFKTSRKLRYKLYKSRVQKELTINKYQTELDTWDSLGFPSIEELEKQDGFEVPDEIVNGLIDFSKLPKDLIIN
jgi:hypothetical protein